MKKLVGCNVAISIMCAAFMNGLDRRTGARYAKLQQYPRGGQGGFRTRK
jgi:hypothetical protein